MSGRHGLAPRDAREARQRQVVAVVVAVVCVVAIAAGVKGCREPGASGPPAAATSVTSAPTSPTSASPSATPSPSTTSASSSRTTPAKPRYRSTGRFTRVRTGTPVRGKGTGRLVTYRVEVEQGSGVSPSSFADAVDRTLGDRRGWTADRRFRFQRVRSGQPELVIKLATPKTVDARCAAAGAQTHGYASCRAGQEVLLNLDRWLVGVPHVKDLALYRHYLVNHEVGHGLGYGHAQCPGKGRKAPVMLQQTLGLHGCTANAWPLKVTATSTAR